MSLDLASLAGAIAAKGAPILAQALSAALPPPFGAIVGGLSNLVIDALATSFGTPPGDAPALERAIRTDPDAEAKVKAVEDRYATDLQSAIQFAQMQHDMNKAVLEATSDLGVIPAIFFNGWRPAFYWVVVVGTIYILSASVAGWPPIPLDRWEPIWVLFGAGMGLRSLDKYLGTSPDAPAGRVIEAIKRGTARARGK